MARTTFGRAGQPIVIDDGANTKPTVVELIDDDRGFEDDLRATISANEDFSETIDGRNDSDSASTFREIGNTTSIDERTGEYVQPITAVPKQRKKRGPNKPRIQKSDPANVVSVQLEKVLLSLHATAAAILKEPDLLIDEDDAKILGEAIREVAIAYDFKSALSTKQQATIDLTLALGTIYVPRAMKIMQKNKRHKPNVVQMPAAQTV